MAHRRRPARKSPSLSRLQRYIQQIGIGGPFRDTPRERTRRARALEYTLGLLLPGERKSMQPSALRVPGAQYESIQHFITDAPWDWGETQARLLDLMAKVATGPNGILAIDDVPLVKQGAKSPGVHRQYCGVIGQVGNCQALVDAVYLLPGDGPHRETIGWCFGIDLYLPKAWAEDPERCREAGIPLPVTFREKWRIALQEVDKARRHGLAHRATVADCGYGDAQDFRAQLRAWKEPYVVEVTAKEVRVVPSGTELLPVGEPRPGRRGHRPVGRPYLPDGVPTTSPASLAAEAEDWTIVRWGEGTKGPLEGRFTRRKIRVCRGDRIPTDEVGWLLLEDTPEGPRSWICWGLRKTSLEELAAIAHRRFLIERFHEEAKMELGLDHFEGRRWRGLHHHLTLVLIAHTFLVREQLLGSPESGEDESPRPTLAEMRRRVVFEVAWALVSRAVYSRSRAEREGWGKAIARYWAGAG